MKHFVPVTFLTLWLGVGCAGCGKVGDPLPPTIRIPSRIMDLKAVQNQYKITLSWTNPAKYVDGSNAMDLAYVRIFRNGIRVAALNISGAGKPQSTAVEVSDALNTSSIYSVEVETRRGKTSAMSNEVPVEVVDVPGAVLNFHGEMDQHRIWLTWQPPDRNPSFADVYILRREDGGIAPEPFTETYFEDAAVEVGKTYSYTVTAARGGSSPVPGEPSTPIRVIALDTKPPATPEGLQPPIISDSGAILSWKMNTEADLAGYRIYRSDNPDSGFTRMDLEIHTISSVRDENYRPGLYYAVSAEDVDGNESVRSLPVRAP